MAPVRRGRAPAAGKGSARPSKRQLEEEDLPADDVDEFMEERERRRGGAPARRPLDSDSDDDDEELLDDDQIESVFDIDAADTSDEEDEDEDEDVELSDDDLLKKDDDKSSEKSDRAWGQRASAFYTADDEVASDDEETDKLMQEEVKRLQSAKYAEMDEADFADDSLGALAAKAGKGKKASKKASSSASSASALEAEQVEVVEKDIDGMTSAELRALIRRQAPELLDLLADFKTKITDVRETIAPLINQLKAGALPTSRGISFLDVKYQLLLSYCMNLAFYFHLKASGRPVKDHPVVAQLVELRAFLEKLRPLESKFKYQIDKLAKAASADGSASVSASAAATAAQDPLSFRPNLASLAAADEAAPAGSAAAGAASDEPALFRPSRMAAVHFDEESKAAKQQRRAERLLSDKGRKGRLLRELQAEFSDRPEVVTELRVEDPDEERARERTRYEEENFVRLQVSRAERKKRKLGSGLPNELADLEDFGDVGSFGDIGAPVDDDALANSFDELRKRPRRDQKKIERIAQLRDDEPSGEMERDAEEFYENVRASKKQRRDEREETAAARRQAKAAAEAAELEAQFAAEEEGDGDGKRGATNDILKNRGLTPKRNKNIKNPRVKRRVRFEQAKIKLKSAGVKQAVTPTSAYAGEATGIKAKLSRSVRIG